jgi:hypothetical protein
MRNSGKGALVVGFLALAAIPLNGANLIVNGDFSSGNTGFQSTYTFSSAPGLPTDPCYLGGGPPWAMDAGCYAIASALAGNTTHDYHNAFATISDHTTGSGAMLLANGAAASTYVWRQTVTVAANTAYLFSAWATSVYNGDPSPANLQIQVDTTAGCASAASFSTIGTINATTNIGWVNSLGSVSTGSSTSICVRILNQNTAAGGNDYALDDIFLDVDTRVPAAADASVSTTTGVGGVRNVVTSDVTAGSEPVDAASVDLDPGTAGRQTTFTFSNTSGSLVFTVDDTGQVTYTPSAGFGGTAAVDWRVYTTGTPPVPSNVATLSVTVSPVLTAAANGAGSGSISEGTNIACNYDGSTLSGTCSAVYPAGSSLTVTATPVASTVSWSGCTSSSGGTCNLVNLVASTTVTATFLADQTITFGPAPLLVIGDSGTISATGGGSGNPVVFSSLTPSVCSVSGDQVNGLALGSCIIAADQAGGGGYSAAPQATLSFQVQAEAIPALSVSGLMVLLAAVAAAGAWILRRG